MFIIILKISLLVIICFILAYTLRHYIFTMNRLFGHQRHPYTDIEIASWPSVAVLVPAHNEEAVIAHSLEALLNANYPHDKLTIHVINDRSTDRTKEIIDGFAARFPNIIKPLHRTKGKGGKAAALKEVMEQVQSEIIIIFDADYIPGKGLIKQLASPFFDPEVGAVMGRVVPVNTSKNLLTRLLDLERSAGYQVDQQARMNMGLVPQYAGTVGGIRLSALESVGGWLDHTLAEDTDLTYRLMLKGWKSIYQNRSECYEEVPENWLVRIRQVKRWATGHNQALARYSTKWIFNRNISFRERIDGLMLLGIYAMSPIVILGWFIAVTLFYLGEQAMANGAIALIAVASYSSIGNFAVFFEICTAVHLDRGENRVRLLPLNFFNFVISIFSVTAASMSQIINCRNCAATWDKTPRYRANSFMMS
jgi:cellulose synthase/poly-beta-1,6-N-acetylglucosamine synthase-like glycosyltransferase